MSTRPSRDKTKNDVEHRSDGRPLLPLQAGRRPGCEGDRSSLPIAIHRILAVCLLSNTRALAQQTTGDRAEAKKIAQRKG